MNRRRLLERRVVWKEKAYRAVKLLGEIEICWHKKGSRASQPPPPFAMTSPRRDRRGYGSIVLGVASIVAVAGAAYWYLSGAYPLRSIWNRPNVRTKRKSVVVVLNQVCLSMSHADAAAYTG